MFKKLMLSTLLVGFVITNANPLAQHPDAYSVNLKKPEVLAIAHWRNLTIEEAFRQGVARIAYVIPSLGLFFTAEALLLGSLYCYKKYTSENNSSLQNNKELIQDVEADFNTDLKNLEKRLTHKIDNCVKKYPDLIDTSIIL